MLGSRGGGGGDQNHLFPAPSALLALTDFYPGSPPFFSRVVLAPRKVNGSEGFKLHVTHKAVPKHAKDILIQDRILFFKLTLISKQNSASHRSSSFAWSAATEVSWNTGLFLFTNMAAVSSFCTQISTRRRKVKTIYPSL